MSLVLALKNRNSLVVASDSNGPSPSNASYGQLMTVSNRTVLLISGNLMTIEHAVTQILPKLDLQSSPATVAQLVQASLVLEVVPHIANLKGRVEIIVAGFDPIRHVEEPSLYYMDSAQDFSLQIVQGDAVGGGSTAAVASLLVGHSFADSSTAQLKVLAKECLAATKLRWPGTVMNHIKLGVITPDTIQIADY